MRSLALAAATCLVALTSVRADQAALDRVTVPLIVDANRPFVMVTLQRADGSTREARFLIDTGGGGLFLTETLAKDLGLRWGTPRREAGESFATVTKVPPMSLGKMPLDVDPARVVVTIGADNILPAASHNHAEGLFPAHVLARYHVVVDYPGGTFTIARPGVLAPQGEPFPMPVGKTSKFPRTEITVAGATYGMLLDTGASFTMVSENVLKSWGSSHAEWERHPGAFGEAATLGGQTLETMFVPAGKWAGRDIGPFGVVSQSVGVFEHWMSQAMAKPIVGSLAGNVLKHYRVDLDYAHETLYLSGS